MNRPSFVRGAALAAAVIAAAVLAASPAQAVPASWSGPNAKCAASAPAPDWCYGTTEATGTGYTTTGDEYWPKGTG